MDNQGQRAAEIGGGTGQRALLARIMLEDDNRVQIFPERQRAINV